MQYLFCFILFAICSALFSEGSMQVSPLKGIKEFTVLVPGLSHPAEKKFFIQEIEKMGSAKLFTFTKAPVDYTGMGTGMCLTLNIYKEDVLGNSDAGIIGIDLMLNTSVEVVKTKQSCDAHIWEATLHTTKEQLMEGVKQIVTPFIHSYREANPNEKPTIYIYW